MFQTQLGKRDLLNIYLSSNFSLQIEQIFAFSFDFCCSFVNNSIVFFLILFTMGGALCPRQILVFVVEASGILKTEIFREFVKFIKVFGLKKFFSKIFYLGGSGPFACTL